MKYRILALFSLLLVLSGALLFPHIVHVQAQKASLSSPEQTLPIGFKSHFSTVEKVRLHYVMGGAGSPVVLLHGYGQTWYEWREIMPSLAQHHTVIVPDLPGLGDSAVSQKGYTKTVIAQYLYTLVSSLTHEPIDLVGHDVGVWVAYAYAAQYPHKVNRLVMLEAPIPDKVLYTFSAFTPTGEGIGWHFGFFASHDIPETLIQGRTREWLTWFYQEHAYQQKVLTPAVINEYARHYAVPASLHASFEYYRTLNQDIAQNQVFARTKLEMPVLALGGDHSLGTFEVNQLHAYAIHVQGGVIPACGQWIAEEQPQYLSLQLKTFLG